MKGWHCGATLDFANVGTVEIGTFRQLLLRPALPFAQLAHNPAKVVIQAQIPKPPETVSLRVLA